MGLQTCCNSATKSGIIIGGVVRPPQPPLQALKPPGQKLGGFSISEIAMYGKKPMKPAKKPMKPGKYGPKK
jgi:hypothetical protein